MRFFGIPKCCVLLGLTAGLFSATGIVHAAGPAAGCPSCAAAGPSVEAAELAAGPVTGDETPSFSPFDLGEGAPAQSGSLIAVSMAPNMIGDLLSNGGYICTDYSSYFPTDDGCTPIPIAGGDRRFKISENMSPLPRDRVFYAFNGFQQAAQTVEGREIDVNRHTLGGEKTFWDGDASIELRMPILQGLNAIQTFDNNLTNDDGVEFGNVTLIPKFIIDSDDSSYVFSWGIGINLPTARSTTLTDFGTPYLNIENQAVHLSPFLGYLLLPNDQCYVISYVQADFDMNGNTVNDGSGGFLGRYQDQNLLHFDIAVGHYLYRNPDSRLSAIAAQFELHYTTTMQDTDEVSTLFGTNTVSNPFNRLDLLILTGGVNFQLGDLSWLTVGCAVPLRGNQQDSLTGLHPERPFDAEVQVFFNRFF